MILERAEYFYHVHLYRLCSVLQETRKVRIEIVERLPIRKFSKVE